MPEEYTSTFKTCLITQDAVILEGKHYEKKTHIISNPGASIKLSAA